MELSVVTGKVNRRKSMQEVMEGEERKFRNERGSSEMRERIGSTPGKRGQAKANYSVQYMRMTRAVESQKGEREEESWLKRGQDIGQFKETRWKQQIAGSGNSHRPRRSARVCVEKLAWTVIK
jgi:hypothetical protein